MERAQAGLDLTDKDALNEYLDSAIAAALLGVPIGTAAELGQRGLNEYKLLDQAGELDKPLFTKADKTPVTQVDVLIDSNPDVVKESTQILKDFGFNPENLKTKQEIVKAASVVLKNRQDLGIIEDKQNTLKRLGYEEKIVDDYIKQKDKNSLVREPIENLIKEVDQNKDLTPQEIKNKIDTLKQSDTSDIKNLDAVIQGIDKQSLDKIQFDTEVGLLLRRQVPVKPQVSTKTAQSTTTTDKKTLSIDPEVVKKRLAENIKNKGLYEAEFDLNKSLQEGSDIGEAIATKNFQRSLDVTLQDFADNEKSVIDSKPLRDYVDETIPENARKILETGKSPQKKSPADFYQTFKPTIDKIEPVANSFTFEPQVPELLNSLVKEGTKKEIGTAKGIKKFKPTDKSEQGTTFKEKIDSNPFVKVQSAIFVNSAIKGLKNLTPSELVESFHFAFENGQGIITQRDKDFIKRTKQDILNNFGKNHEIPSVTLEYFDTPSGVKEILGNIYSDYIKDSKTSLKGYDPQLKAIMRKVKSFSDNLNKDLKKKGLFDIQQIAPGLDAQMTQGLFSIQEQRFNQQANEAALLVRNKDMTELVENPFTEFAKELKDQFESVEREATPWNNIKFAVGNKYIALAGVVVRAARNNPVMAKLVSFLDLRDESSSRIQSKLEVEGIGRIKEISAQSPTKARQTFDWLQKSTQTPDITDKSVTFYTKDGKVFTSNDPVVIEFTKLAKKISDLSLDEIEQAYIKEPLKELGLNETVSEDLLKNTVQLLKARQELLKLDTTKNKDIKKEIDNLSAKQAYIENILKWKERVKNFKSQIYVPRKRIGEYGLTVVDKKTGEQHGFYTLRKGTVGDSMRGFSKADLNQEVARIKQDYKGLGKQFKVLGAEKFSGDRFEYEIDNLDVNTVKPNRLTKNKIIRELNQRGVTSTIEDLADLAQIDGDKEIQEALENILTLKKATNGSYQFLLPSNNYNGASLDIADAYQRHSDGISHYISNRVART